MTSKQELLRKRIVTFFLKHENEPKIFTVNHFKAEGVPRSTVFRIISIHEHRLTTQNLNRNYCFVSQFLSTGYRNRTLDPVVRRSIKTFF